jgi:hypothetical protein
MAERETRTISSRVGTHIEARVENNLAYGKSPVYVLKVVVEYRQQVLGGTLERRLGSKT